MPRIKATLACPNCGHDRCGVEETRPTPECIYRVRKCPECGWRVTTHEKWAEDQSIPNLIRRPKGK